MTGKAIVGWVLFVFNITISLVLIYIFLSKVDIAPEAKLGQEQFLTISLTILQCILGALAIGLGLAAVFGYQAIKGMAEETARKRAEEVAGKRAEEIASDQVRAYLQTQGREPRGNAGDEEVAAVLRKILSHLESQDVPVPRKPRRGGRSWEDVL